MIAVEARELTRQNSLDALRIEIDKSMRAATERGERRISMHPACSYAQRDILVQGLRDDGFKVEHHEDGGDYYSVEW